MSNPGDFIRPGSNVETDRVYHHDTVVTTAQVLALAATNVELVAAPPTGFAIVPTEVYLFHDHGGTDYVQDAADDALAIRYSASTEIAELGSEAQGTAFIEAAADARLYVGLGNLAHVPVLATALDLDMNGGTEHITGDGALNIRVVYRIVPAGPFT